MADTQDTNKGQDFLTRTFIKNQSVINRKDDSLLENTLKKNVKSIDGLNKQVNLLNQNLVKITKPTQEKKDFVRRDDPFKKLYLAVDDLEGLMRESVNLQKEKKKNKGLLEWFGALSGLGGLLGFLLTGKGEFLNSIIKAITKYSPLKLFLGAIDTLIKKSGSFIIKPIMGLFKGIGHVFEPLGKLFGKFGGKEAAKLGAKGAAKSFLKKIPVIGGLIGLFFGIQRFQNKQYVEGLLEIASGIASVVPGIGTALSVAIDAFLLMNDFSNQNIMKSMVSGATGVIKKVGPEVLKSIPGIGTIIHFKEAMELWKTDKIGSIKEILLTAGSIIPGFNLIAEPILGFIETFVKGGGIGKTAGAVLKTAKDVITNPIGTVTSLFSKGKSAVAETYQKGKQAVSGAISNVKEFPGKMMEKALDVSSNFYASSENFLANAKGGEGGISYKDIDSAHMVPWVWKNFQDMVIASGRDIKVNSAFRTIEKQQYLYDKAVKKYGAKKAGKYVAPPGKSMHNYGYAIDINSSDGNFLESSGLLEKFGFTRPMSHEPWHIEPIGLKEKYADVRSGVNFDSPENIGDAYSIKSNLPRMEISEKNKSTQNREKIDLSENTIIALAQAMGMSFKGALPRSQSNIVSIDTSMRG